MEPGAEAHGQTAVLGRGRRLANQAPAHEFEPVRGPVRQRMELFRFQRLARCTGVSLAASPAFEPSCEVSALRIPVTSKISSSSNVSLSSNA